MHQYNLKSALGISTNYTNLSNYCQHSDDNGYGSGDQCILDMQEKEDEHWENMTSMDMEIINRVYCGTQIHMMQIWKEPV